MAHHHQVLELVAQVAALLPYHPVLPSDALSAAS
jgi:hypothetical protein